MFNQRSSYKIRVLFAIFLLSVLNLARAETTTSSSSSASSSSNVVSYATQINGGELSIKMRYDPIYDTRLAVVIGYDTEVTSASDFFHNQLTVDLYNKVSACGVVYWNFMPCGTSKLNMGELTCPKGADQCRYDKIHACVAKLYQKDEQKVGVFVTCFFVNNKDLTKCVADAGLVHNDIDQCMTSNGATNCDAFYQLIHAGESQQSATATTPNSATGTATSDGTTDFKKVLCDNLTKSKLQCDVCTT
ncbi:uncharacterized protein LOC135844370 [Planococcus citri]|uniref:uncharacterized protein LOC135844370 n=1 Tax=Planococcus citri TaxID=170843 RepID=UPI0031F99A36